MNNIPLGHLVNVLGLAVLPREHWSKQDVEAFDNARKYAAQQLELAAQQMLSEGNANRERQCTKGDAGCIPEPKV